MKFLLIIILTTAFTIVNSRINGIDEKRLTDIINLIWPPPPNAIVPDVIKKDVPIPTEDRSGTCTCVAYHFCKNVTSSIGDPKIVDISNSNGKCMDYLQTCCESSNILTTPALPITRTSKGCGFRNSKGVGFRIRGGTNSDAQFGEFPWMVAILEEESGDTEKVLVYQCGGSLIHPKVVLTSTHCVLSDDSKYLIRAGEWDTQTRLELLPYQDRTVVDIITHPEYNSGSLFNDIALLILDKAFDITDNVDTVCLPPANMVLENIRCFASGWGKDSYEREGKYQVILQKNNLPIVQNDICQEQLRKTRLGNEFMLHSSFICAGGEKGIDTCKGDGGSPLVCPIPGQSKNRYHLGGIVSWGVGCGGENIPGLYANVPLFRNWVDEEMIKHDFDTSFYTY